MLPLPPADGLSPYTLVFLIVCTQCSANTYTDDPVELAIQGGRIKGKPIRLPSETTVWAFLGIPYGEPPLGELRFQAPLPKRPWHGVLDTTNFGPICLQYRQRQTWDVGEQVDSEGRRFLHRINLGNYPQAEDCLTLNVYSDTLPVKKQPWHEPQANSTSGLGVSEALSSRPVMVYFHGGSYQMSGGRFYPGEALAAVGGVIVVTVNYRLGPFGFLSLGGESLPGNAGLLDQLLALRWVQNNAPFFGGNPDLVTIFGNSAGGASVGLHLVSPLSAGLFRRAIAQSGSPMARWAIQRHPKRQAQRLARDIGCPTSADLDLLLCMQNADPELISQKAGIPAALFIRFAPVIDGHFLPADPETLVRKGHSHPVPFMTGVTKDEVSVWMSHYNNPSSVRLTKVMVKKYLKYLLTDNSTTDANLDALVHAVYTEYTRKKNGEPGKASKPGDALTLAEIITDVGLKAPGIQMANLMSKHSAESVYLYEFQYASPDDITVQSGEGKNSLKIRLDNQREKKSIRTVLSFLEDGDEAHNASWVGAYHESELHFIFGLPFLELKNAFRLEEDKRISTTLIHLWTNFAKYGNPTPEGATTLNFTWQWYAPNQHKYAILGLKLQMRKDYKEKRLTFWNSFIPLFTEYPMSSKTIGPCPQEGLIGTAASLALLSLLCCSLVVFIFCSRRKSGSLVLPRATPTLV